MITIGEEQIKELFVGEMGVKTVCVGNEVIYTRPGGFLYIELSEQKGA